MSPCLYLIQTDYALTDRAFNRLSQIYQHGDAIVLMGEAALFSQNAIRLFENCYLLTHDAQLLLHVPESINLLSYLEFADLSLQYSRCIRLK